MGHMPMTGPGSTLEAFAAIPVGRRIFVHINNTNPALLSDSPERAHLDAAGWEVAEDGMEIRL
jgi:pyrroloquinoline quinone biosynthesis protein B